MVIPASVPDEFPAVHIGSAQLQSLAALWHADPRKDCYPRQLNRSAAVHPVLHRVLFIHREQAADVTPAAAGGPDDCFCDRLQQVRTQRPGSIEVNR